MPRKIQRGPTSRYHGVEVRAGKALASVRFGRGAGKLIRFGTWPTERDAAIAFDRGVLFLGLDRPLNLPRVSRRRGPLAAADLVQEARALRRVTITKRATVREYSSPYHGVIPGRQGWTGYVRIEGQRVSVGTFRDARDAALARDRVLAGLGDESCPLNFRLRQLLPATVQQMRTWARRERKRENNAAHPYVGITRLRLSREWWRATLIVGSKTHLLGDWPSAKQAALARDRAVLYYRQEPGDLNFPTRAHLLQPADAATLRREARTLLPEVFVHTSPSCYGPRTQNAGRAGAEPHRRR